MHEVKTRLQNKIVCLDRLAPHNRYNTEGLFSHRGTGVLLRKSAESGCHLCTIIWENLVEMDSARIKPDYEWVQEREKLSQNVFNGHHLNLRIRVPSSVYKSSMMGCFQLRFLAFATLRAYIRLPDNLPDDSPHSSNSIMLYSSEEVHGAEDPMRGHVKNSSESYCYRKSDELIEALSSWPHGPPFGQSIKCLRKSAPGREGKPMPYTRAPLILLMRLGHVSRIVWKTMNSVGRPTTLSTRLIDITPLQQDNVVCLVEIESPPLH